MEIVVKENSQIRIDKYLMMMQDISRSKLQKMIDNGYILVNNKKVKASYLVKEDDVVTIMDYEENNDILPQNIPLDIVYEDEYL